MMNNTTLEKINKTSNWSIPLENTQEEASFYALSHPLYIAHIVQISLTLLTNFVLMIVITNRKTLRKKKSCQLMYNLLLVDCLLSSLHFITFFYHLRLKNHLSCGLLLQTVCTLICLVWDRYQEIEDPFSYETNAKVAVLLQVVPSWLLSILLSLILIFTGASQMTLKIVHVVLVGIALISFIPSNCFVYCTARTHARSALRYTVETNPTIKKEMKRLKSTYMPITICSVFCVCWIPYAFFNLLNDRRNIPCQDVVHECLERIAVFSCALYPLFFAGFCGGEPKRGTERICARCTSEVCSCTCSKRRSRSTHTLSVECKDMTGDENAYPGTLEY